MSYNLDAQKRALMGLTPPPLTGQAKEKADERLARTPCSQLVVMREVFEAITKEMAAMERIEAKAAEDRHWSMADAMKNKRLAYDSALGFAMRGIERAFSSANQ